MLCIAIIYAIADLWIPFQQGPHAFHLVVCQGIHRINDNGPHAEVQGTRFLLPEQVVNNREQETLRFTGTCTGGHD